MNTNDFPACCGIKVLTRFGYDDSTEVTHEQCEEYLKINETRWKGQISFLMVCLNEVENKKFEKRFLERKWYKIVDGWNNPRTDHKLFLWVFSCSTKTAPFKEAITKPIVKKRFSTLVSVSVGPRRKRLARSYGW